MKTSICLAMAAIGMISTVHGQTVDPTRGRDPGKIVPRADQQRATAPPTKGQQVAVLNIRLEADNGKIMAARVDSSRTIASYAPKVFARRGGPWEVIIDGKTRRSFFVDNPAMREAEAHPSSGDKYQWVGVTGPIDWPLIVPLYADGQSLGARSITIRDTRSGAIILQAEI
ncbi:hypothetical protein KY495_23325 [Massilia sp. PAMC28688]|uniref:hypothetical protein n=1 Tax=Massilia sp. PAMC28688 TaxID=2861283 RepID=UPI001C62ACE4|nr:hypothetical protein [Massilia sp. PAMC28688]QYF93552.1 hypothetical protein KY495_23325 [Massilia sp. PAMC28688]